MSRSPGGWSSSSELDNESCYDLLPTGQRYSVSPEFSAASIGSDRLSSSPTAVSNIILSYLHNIVIVAI